MVVGIIRNPTELQNEILNAGDKTVLLKFSATWCKPCREIKPMIEEYSERFAKQFVFLELDVDNSAELVNHFKVRSMPTIIFIRKNIVIKVIVGANIELIESTCELISNATFPELMQ